MQSTQQASQLEHYDALAEHIVLQGMDASQLEQVASYRPGMTFQDVAGAVQAAGPAAAARGFEAAIAAMATNLAQVVEID
ncbi:hypothetical protein COY28_07020, partial [Candidatus Woesearchaeota archaeon CG_4_10_14_0_2_um_filter_57_5]